MTNKKLTVAVVRIGVKNALNEVVNDFLVTRSASIAQSMISAEMEKESAIKMVDEVIAEISQEYEEYRAFERKHEL